MYIERTVESVLQETSEHFRVVLVTGPRQIGKTTVLKHLAARARNYVSLDDPDEAALARKDPALFLQRHQTPLLIDEVQYAPQLFPYIKMRVDNDQRHGQYWMTGSQPYELMRGVTESLAGRIGIVDMLGLSTFEAWGLASAHAPFLPVWDDLKKREAAIDAASKTGSGASVSDLKSIYRIIWRGSFPGLVLDEGMDRDTFFSSYLRSYLERDVSHLSNVGDEGQFVDFLRAAAARTGQLLNLSDLARDAEISVSTAKRWLDILRTSGIVTLLEPYHTNLTKRLVKTPKLYFLDTGLCAYLAEWPTPEILEAGAMSGAFLETYVFSEILKSYWHNGKRPRINFYRDKDTMEIDFLIVRGDGIFPIEVKKSASPSSRTVLPRFQALNKLQRKASEAGVVCFVESLRSVNETTSAIPVGLV